MYIEVETPYFGVGQWTIMLNQQDSGSLHLTHPLFIPSFFVSSSTHSLLRCVCVCVRMCLKWVFIASIVFPPCSKRFNKTALDTSKFVFFFKYEILIHSNLPLPCLFYFPIMFSAILVKLWIKYNMFFLEGGHIESFFIGFCKYTCTHTNTHTASHLSPLSPFLFVLSRYVVVLLILKILFL